VTFREWQGQYAARGIPTFPIGPNKKPMVSRYNRFGLPASAAIAQKFPDAPGIGFMAGKRNGITIGDVDEVGEKPLQCFLDRHGDTPIIVRTATGKHHCWYRHNGERRVVRPESGIEVDILGGGIAIAPQSHGPSGQYQFIAGGLDSLDRLPVMRDVPPKARSSIELPTAENAEIVPDGVRDISLWRACMEVLADRRARTFEELLAVAHDYNHENCSPPQPDEGVMHAAMSAWKYEQEGRNWFGKPGIYFPAHEADRLIRTDQDAFLLLSFAKANNRPDRTFMLANGLAETFGWGRKRLSDARKRLTGTYLEMVRRPRQKAPALYRWKQHPLAASSQTGQK
jgi:hypothetical protein